ncbi:MAG: alpha-ketoacid dehydrogenase subunit beta [Solirubrobacterales bacterium]
MARLKFAEAIRSALAAEMEEDERVVVIGEEVGRLGGVFTVTQGLQERFGEDRVLDAPICENSLVGWGVGAAVEGMRPVVELMFSDFSLLAMDQIANLAAKIHYMSNGQFAVPLVIRMPSGGGTKHGPQHSQSLESVFAHVPGLLVAMPSDAGDAYWMLRDAIRCDDPVIFLENKYLYFRSVDEVDENEGPRGLGARMVRPGDDITVVTAGAMTSRCCEAATLLQRPGYSTGVSCDVLDLRYMWPMDTEAIAESVRKTGRLAVVHEAVEFCGWGAEVAAWAAGNLFRELDAPVTRVGAARVPIPVGFELEEQVIPTTDRIQAALQSLADF